LTPVILGSIDVEETRLKDSPELIREIDQSSSTDNTTTDSSELHQICVNNGIVKLNLDLIDVTDGSVQLDSSTLNQTKLMESHYRRATNIENGKISQKYG
jgi:hypothetical protein